MSYIGDFAPGATVKLQRTTVDAAGQPQAWGSAAVAVFRGTLSSAIAAGVAITTVSTTGVAIVAVDTSQDAAAYVAGDDYFIRATAGTVSGVGITGYVLGQFSLSNRGQVAGVSGIARANVVQFNSVAAAGNSGFAQVSVVQWLGVAPAPLVASLVQARQSGIGDSNVTQTLGVAIAAASGFFQTNVAQWRGVLPAVLAGSGSDLVQVTTSGGGTNVTVTAFTSNAQSQTADAVWTVQKALRSAAGTTGEVIAAAVTAPSNFSALSITGSGRVGADVQNWRGALPAVLAGSGSNLVQVLTSGGGALGDVNVTQIGGTAVTAASGFLVVNVGQWRGVQPSTLISGRVDANAQALGTGAITTGAYTAGALATTVFASNFLTSALIDSTASNALADALLDRADGIEPGITPRQEMRASLAANAGRLSGAGTAQINIHAGATSGAGATTRITAVVDASGNRSSVILNI